MLLLRRVLLAIVVGIVASAAACGHPHKTIDTTMPSAWTEPEPAAPGAEDGAPVEAAAAPVESAPAPVAVTGPRPGMYHCGFGDFSKYDPAADLLWVTGYPCIIQRAAGRTTLEKLRGFIRFRGEVVASTPDAFTFTGEVARDFGAGQPRPVSWSFTQPEAGRWVTADSDRAGLEFVGDSLEYGGTSYGGYQFGDSRTP